MISASRFSLSMRTAIGELSILIEQVEDWGRQQSLPMKSLQTLCIVLDELISNSIVHGYRNADNGSIDIQIEKSDDLLMLALRDQAPPFDPLAQSHTGAEGGIESRSIGGLGIDLVRRLSTSISYRRVGNTNELLVTINLGSDAGSTPSS